MLTGPELGKALDQAMQKKGVKQDAVAKEFEVAQPSVSEWLKYGRIAKKHINHLVAYFSDVVQPSHWGLPNSWQEDQQPVSSEAMALARTYDRMKPAEQQKLRLLMLVAREGVQPDIKPATETAPPIQADPAEEGSSDFGKLDAITRAASKNPLRRAEDKHLGGRELLSVRNKREPLSAKRRKTDK